MSIRQRVMALWRGRRTRLERNHAVLRRAAEEIGREFEAKSYEELRDHGAEDFDSDRIVEGVRVHYSGEAYRTLANGDLAFNIDVSGLPTRGGARPSYHFYKRPDGSVYY
ncbi:MAG TPA: hypothetical protein VFM44_02415 [Gemmatimonadota bacterium]|nr:hypothetical protein [Gemmatimonadota bacterium]